MSKKPSRVPVERPPETVSEAEYELRVNLAIGLGGAHDRHFITTDSADHEVDAAFDEGVEWARERTKQRVEEDGLAKSADVDGWLEAIMESDDRRQRLLAFFREGRFTNSPGKKRVFYVGDDSVILSGTG